MVRQTVLDPLNGFRQSERIRFGKFFEWNFGTIDPCRGLNGMLFRYKQQPAHHGRRVLGIVKIANEERIRNQMHRVASIDEPSDWSRNTSEGGIAQSMKKSMHRTIWRRRWLRIQRPPSYTPH
jgi:hypothetical protein